MIAGDKNIKDISILANILHELYLCKKMTVVRFVVYGFDSTNGEFQSWFVLKRKMNENKEKYHFVYR